MKVKINSRRSFSLQSAALLGVPGVRLYLVVILVFIIGRVRYSTGVRWLLLLAMLGGCAVVPPHARGRLAQPDMELDANADLSFGQEHADEYREGAAGGFGAGGGGCGCN